jgi:serine/threonine-protein kinase
MDMTADRGTASQLLPQGGPPRIPAGALLAGRFSIDDFLGRSVFAEVFRATDNTDGKAVVIKLLHRELTRYGEARMRLEQEMAIAVQLEHKNIARVYGFWIEGDLPFIASEYVEGSTLREMLDKKVAAGRAFSLKGAYNVVAHVCNALAYAHGAVVHGALTTSSVLVNAAGRVKLTDFGIAPALPAMEHFRAQVGAGDLATMAPEMATHPEAVDRRADLYSVGAMLFELLTGRPPSETFERPSAVVPGLPASLDPVIERCLRPRPQDRFGDAQELKHALHSALDSYVSGGTPAAGVAALDPPEARPVSSRPPPAYAAAPAPAFQPPPPRPAPPPPPAASRAAPPRAPTPPTGAPIASSPAPAPAPRAPRISQPAIPRGFNVDSALSSVDETQERWLIQKDKLDFGPYRLAEVRHQVEKGQILGDHTIVDMENGERRRVKDHPMLRDFVLRTESGREEQRRADADAAEARASKRKVITLLAVILVVLLAGGGGVVAVVIYHPFGLLMPKETTKIVYKDNEDLLKGIEITMKVDPPAPKKAHKAPRKGPRRPGESPDVTNLGDASEDGGDETLSQDVVQRVMSANFGVLKGCVLEEKRRNPSMRTVDMDFTIKGDGRVSAVKVNGQTASAISSCMYGKMQSVAFPKFNGSKTHASFSLALK